MKTNERTVTVISGSSLQGYIEASYEELVSTFGEPEKKEDDKVNNLWVVNFEGVIATIYDYKEDLETGKVERWHVGGYVAGVSDLVRQALDENGTVPTDYDSAEDYEQDRKAAAETIANGDY